MLRLQPDLLADLDAYISRQIDPISRPEAVRRLMAWALDLDALL